MFWFFFFFNSRNKNFSAIPLFQCLLSIATLSHCSLHFTIFPHPVLRTACVLGEPSKVWDSPEGCERGPLLQGWGRNFTACISLMQSLESLWLAQLESVWLFRRCQRPTAPYQRRQQSSDTCELTFFSLTCIRFEEGCRKYLWCIYLM